MAGLTLEQAEARLTQYLAAEEAILTNQKIKIDDRELTRADLASIQEGIKLWNRRCQSLSRTGGIAVREVIPR